MTMGGGWTCYGQIGRGMLAGFCLAIAMPAVAQQTLVADLNEQQVSITTDFTGAELLLFGTIDQEMGDDLVIIVEGPPSAIAIRRKQRIAGIWINTETATLSDVPSFYQLSSTRPLTDLASAATLSRLGIGMAQLPFELAAGSAISDGNREDWQAALIRNMQNKGLWNEDGDISLRQDVLFRSNIHLPASVLPGQYWVRILHFHDGFLVDESDSLISVAKSGLSARIYSFAQDNSLFYGIFAVIFAVTMGWGAARLFRR